MKNSIVIRNWGNTPKEQGECASDCSKRAMELLRQFRNEPPNTDGSIRALLIEGMDYLELALQWSTEHRDHDYFASFNVMNLAALLCNASKSEFKYAVERLTKWFESGYENSNNGLAQILTVELSKELKNRRTDLSERELVETIMRCKATMGYPLSKLLYIPAVREMYIKKASEGVHRYAFSLGIYYYESEDYEAAFNSLKGLEDIQSAKYLGLMYYYGKGTEQNHELAKEYLERYHESVWCVEPEVIWALGDLYGRFAGGRQQFDLYIKELQKPYANHENPFIKKMLRRCVTDQCCITLRDRIQLTVKIEPENRVCEFSLELPPYCFATINWGDHPPERHKIDGCDMLDRHEKVSFQHTYRKPGIYSVAIEAACHNSIEAFEFCRYKRQLLSVDFERCNGLKKVVIVGQLLQSLDLCTNSYSNKAYLYGLICRDNNISSLDLRHCPALSHLDCSFNPISELKMLRNNILNNICILSTHLDKRGLDDRLRLNRGDYCNSLSYDELRAIDLPLEQYFRLTNWDKVRKYLRINEPDYYDHRLAECEMTFTLLKELSKELNHNPYEDKEGALAVDGSYISDDSILHHEEFFITGEGWTTCLATKVRDIRRRQPWMGLTPTPPEYFVASALVNMIKDWRELKKSRPASQNETGIH